MACYSSTFLLILLLDACRGRELRGPSRASAIGGGANSPHDHGLRSSKEISLPNLFESPLKKYDPGPADLNVTELRLKLGSSFHSGFMSVSQPQRTPKNRGKDFWWKERRRKTEYPLEFLEQLHPNRSTGERPRYPPWIAEELASGSTAGGGRHHLDGGRKRGRRRRRKKGVRMSGLRRLRRLLLSVTQCPIRWSWRDVGVRFWPRWVKEGRCGEASKEEAPRKGHRKRERKGRRGAGGRRRKGEGKRGNSTAVGEEGKRGREGGEEGKEGSCSIPPGMVCRASRARSVTLLRWHCKEWSNGEGESGTKETESAREQMSCRWIKAQYPIVTRCACVCPD